MGRMRGVVLIFLGAFLLVVAILAQTYATSRLEKTSLAVAGATRLSGEATLPREQVDVRVTFVAQVDQARSTDDLVAWTSFSCVVRAGRDVPDCVSSDISSDDSRDALIAESVDHFVTDRVTAQAVNDPRLMPADAVPHEGLVNRFPHDADKKTYLWWDGTAGRAFDAEYVDTVQTAGVETYHYRVAVAGVPIELSDGDAATYTNTTDLYAEPTTGMVLNQIVDQSQVLADGTTVLRLQYAFTDAQVESGVAQARTHISRLRLVSRTVPIIGYAGGALLLTLGLASALLRRREGDPVVNGDRRAKHLVSG